MIVMADVNPLDAVVSLLTTNYLSTNTDNIIPTIAIVYEKPTDKEPKPNEDLIFVYSEIGTRTSIGLGVPERAEVTDVVKIDIRSRPANTSQSTKINDNHARKVLGEVNRVIYSKLVTPGTNYDVIDPQIELTDLSNGMRGVFRYIIKIRLIDYCRDMTT